MKTQEIKIEMTEEEVAECCNIGSKRREDSKRRNLTHTRAAGTIPTNVDDFSIVAESGVAKFLNTETNFDSFGRFNKPDLYFNDYQIDVKSSFGKPSFAICPDSLNRYWEQNEKPIYIYVTGNFNPEGGATVHIVGTIEPEQIWNRCPLSNFGYENRPEAYKVSIHHLNDISAMIKN